MNGASSRIPVRWLRSVHGRFAGVFNVLSAPMPYWPLGWHVLLALLVVTAAGFGAVMLHELQVGRQQQAAQRLHLAQAALADAERAAATRTNAPDPTLRLALRSELDHVIRDLASVADAQGVRLGSIRIDEQGAGRQHARLVITTSAQAAYPPLKQWLGELLYRHEALALSTLSMRRLEAGGGSVDAHVSFILFVRPGP